MSFYQNNTPLTTPFYPSFNSFFSFSSSILVADFFNRFGFFFRPEFCRAFVEFNFKLPFENILSKFKNRIHFLLYYLFFELLVSQKPRILVRRERLMNLSNFKNKREIKKAKESIGIQAFSFSASLLSQEQINRFFLIVSFFLAPFSDKKLNPPSKYIQFYLTESQNDFSTLSLVSIQGLVKNLSVFPNFNLIDDLSANSIGLNVKLYPFGRFNVYPSSKTIKIPKLVSGFFGVAYGLSFENFLNCLNLRFFKN